MSYYLLEADGSNRAEAETKTLEFLGLKKGDLDFEVITEKKGLMSLFKSSKTVTLAYPNKEDLPIEAHAKGVITTIISKMGVDAQIREIGEKDDNLYIELTTTETGFLIGKHGRTLDSLQFLVNLIVHTNCQDKQRIMLDVDGYRGRREKNLKELSLRMANKVSKSGRSILLNYMNPYERRMVHMFLEEDDRVKTESDGNGVYKRLRIISTQKKPIREKSNSIQDNQSPKKSDDQIHYTDDSQQLAEEHQPFVEQELYQEPEVNHEILEGS